MKLKRLLARVTEFQGADEETQKQEIKAIRKVLKLLKKKEKALKEKLKRNPERDDAESIRTSLKVIYVQRTKGVERVRELKAQDVKGESD
ncbi:conserved hypothetical protein [Luminiphilus syltensis NOR5-1B]|uniref:Uncharacterized protein n=1 Tax=Luminiphilus syltensis NOR5-1B TaxID=565045 RepID=B8KRF0_9GAMM|nr:hypothetical protein [Luminiphilus syltensis]EED35462.1 conserved hypothetical protein [Luminiphilus syltensis NOR5-1B]